MAILIYWIKPLYSNITACTINNLYLLHNFTIERGIRQGCPLSALLFILVAEILSINLRSNHKAKGIIIDELEYKIIQLADNTTIFTKDLDSLQAFIAAFKHFENVSGLKLNFDKSEIIPLGSLRRTDFVIPTKINMLKVNKKAFKTFCLHHQELMHFPLFKSSNASDILLDTFGYLIFCNSFNTYFAIFS